MFCFAFKGRLKQVEVCGGNLKFTTFKVCLLSGGVPPLKQSLWIECHLHRIRPFLLGVQLISASFHVYCSAGMNLLVLYLYWIMKNLKSTDRAEPPPTAKWDRIFMASLSLRFGVCGSTKFSCLQYLTGMLFTGGY